ncbi:MAG: hypothetical protein LBT30_02130 [Clostridiales bacterium]|jgi:cyclic beta-1,2-glucan synthetase|nr:hypothetical protein [Clostridiales bacterium]
MFWIVAAVFVAGLLLGLCIPIYNRVKANKAGIVSDSGTTLDEKKYKESIEMFAAEVKNAPEGGYFVPRRMTGAVHTAYSVIRKKIGAGHKVYEFEKWIYDNYYILSSIGDFRGLTALKNIEGKPLLVRLAGLIIDGSVDTLTFDRIKKGIYAYTALNSLSVDEVLLLKEAFSYAVFERIEKMAKRVLLLNRAYQAAKKPRIDTGLLQSNCYLYFLFDNNANDSEEIMSYLQKNGVDYDGVNYIFRAGLAESDAHTASLISYLLEKDNYGHETILGFSALHRKLSGDEIYKNSDTATKIAYLKQISLLAKKSGKNPLTFYDKLMRQADVYKRYFGELLFYYPRDLLRAIAKEKYIPLKDRSAQGCGLYAAAVFCLAALLGTAAVFLTKAVFAPLFFLMFVRTAFFLVNYLLGFFRRDKTVFRMDFPTVGAEDKAMVVISEYITSKKQLNEACRKALIVKAANDGKNTEYALLIDFAPSDKESDEADAPLLKAIKEYDGELSFFVRKRTLHFGRYSGHERKRGAVMELTRYMAENDGGGFVLIKRPVACGAVKYFIFLDDDNELLPDSITGLVNAIIHPLNKKYDLMTLGAKYNMYSLTTRYSRRFEGQSGIESYPYYSGLFYRIFGTEIFTGKGIVRVSSLYDKLYGKLPENRVLSHDIIEGAVLSTSSSGIAVFEDAPKDFCGDTERMNRWSKGDILLLIFLKNRQKSRDGKGIKLKISLLYKTVIAVNAVGILYAFCVFALIMLAYFGAARLLLNTALIVLFSVFIGSALSTVRELFIPHKRMAYRIKDSAAAWLTAAAELLMLPFFAVNGIAVYCKALFHLWFRPQKILEWKTFYHTQNGRIKNALPYAAPSFFVMTALGVADYFLNGSLILMCAAFVYLAVFWVYTYNGEGGKTDAPVSLKNQEFLLNAAQKTYRFFEENLTENPLICDNFQKSPYLGRSENTSPTNIGFSLLALIAGYFLEGYDGRRSGAENKNDVLSGKIKDMTAFEKVVTEAEKIIAAVERLDKYHGHLFNWYDIDTGAVLPSFFVSSVDSANFISALTVLKEFLDVNAAGCGEGALKERCGGLYKRVKQMIEECNFSALYDFKRNLFYIGHEADNTKKFTAHYDLLASESRLLSYLGTVNSLPCWFKLSRKAAKPYGNTLYSWSGTMFEYLMADIFLKPPEHSLLLKSSRNAAKVQKNTRCNGVFGLSESGYYRFDENMKYQYTAFGVNILSLKSRSNQCVISPYSSFLSLKYLKDRAIDNLKRLGEKNMTGEYGYFEAMDFSENKTVASYMAHHQGMIMCSVTNYLFDDVFCTLFMRDGRVASGRHLLAERKLVSKPSKSVKRNVFADIRANQSRSYFFDKPHALPVYNVLSNGNYSVVADDSGRGYSVYGNIHVTKEPEAINDAHGKYFYAADGSGEIFSPTYAPLFKEPDAHTAEFFRDKCVYTETKRACVHTVRVPAGFNGEIHTFSIENSGEPKKYKVYFFGGDIVLGDYNAYQSHKTFYNMFVSVGQADPNCFVVKRKKIYKDDKNYYAAMLVKGADVSPEFNRYNFIGRKKNLSEPDILKGGARSESTGDMTEPCFGFVSEMTLKKNERKEFSVIITAAHSEDELNAALKRAKTLVFDKLITESPDIVWQDKLTVLNDAECGILTDILPAVIDGSLCGGKKKTISSSDRFFEIYRNYSGNFEYKILYYKHSGDRDEEYLISVLKVFNIMKNAAVKVKLLISEPRFDVYHDPIKQIIRRYVKDFGASVCVLDEGEIEAFIAENAFLNFNLRSKARTDEQKRAAYINAVKDGGGEQSGAVLSGIYPQKKPYFVSGAGYFTDEGSYVVQGRTGLPYSNVVALKYGGFVVTDNGGGFTFFDNSRENKVSVSYNDPVSDTPSEAVFIARDGCSPYRINKGGSFTEHINGMTVFVNRFGEYSTVLKEYMIADGYAKVFEAEIENNSQKPLDMTLFTDIAPALGYKESSGALSYRYGGDAVYADNHVNGQTAVLKIFGGEIIKDRRRILCREGYRADTEAVYDAETAVDAMAAKYSFRLKPDCRKKFFFVLAKSEAAINGIEPYNIDAELANVMNYFGGLNKIKIDTGDKYLDMMFNHRLMYQVVASRLNGKCGFYQAGGATGFRDQLQDMTALVYGDPSAVRRHILLSASRQYTEGDVMHWWHAPRFGVRTKISDDKLFLPYTAFFYINATGDYSVLSEEISYLKSPPLLGYEHSRLESPEDAPKKGALSEHIERAIYGTLKYGAHDLLLIGTGDWNDALDNVGAKGRGESVWLSIFAYRVLTMYKNLSKHDDRLKYVKDEIKLKEAVIKHAFENDRFMRAYTDDGEWIGSKFAKYCRIDLICQSWAAMTGIAPKAMTERALDTARELVDYERGIVKLFDPPFNGEKFYGYISSYPSGVRENGGQYTHAVMWYISALFKSGRADEAYKILRTVNPAEIMSGDKSEKYLGEPYVVAADVSASGRAGWSWYTGSAGLMYRVILEDLLGITMENGNLVIKPNLPSAMNSCRAEYRHKNAVYDIEIKKAATGKFIINGAEIKNDNRIPLKNEGKYHVEVIVPLGTAPH